MAVNAEEYENYLRLYNELKGREEKRKASRHKYYENNKDMIAQKSKAYREKNKDKYLAQKKEYYRRNKEAIYARRGLPLTS